MVTTPASSDGAVDQVGYKAALGRFPTGVTIVTTSLDGIDHAMTASAFASVSLDPPLVLVCVEKIARFHEAILARGTWGVSVLGAGAQDVSRWLATRGRPLHGQLDRIPHRRGVTGAALLTDALAWVECHTRSVHDGGDHTIVVGKVVALDVSTSAEPPMVYYGGDYRTIAESGDPEG